MVLAMPPRVDCPLCHQLVLDWHTEWYLPTQQPTLYQGNALLDCPLCHGATSYQGGIIAASQNPSVPLFRRNVIQAATWAQVRENTILENYLKNHPAGQQYTGYFSHGDVQQADQQVQGNP